MMINYMLLTRWFTGSLLGISLVSGLCISHAVAFSASAPVQDDARQKEEGKGSDKEKGSPQQVSLMEGERVNPQDVLIHARSKLIEEGDAVKRMSENEANINNVRFNINDFQVGYSIATEKSNDRVVFRGPTKAWRATKMGEVSRWPPVLYNAARKETVRQAKLIHPVPVAEPLDEMNNLRVYHRPLLVGHDGNKYQEEPTVVAFFVHPKTSNRMTVVFRGGRSYGAMGEPLATSANVVVKEVVPGRSREGSRLVPSIFYFKQITIEAEPLPEESEFNQRLQAALAAREDAPLRTDDFKWLFAEMARRTGGDIEPVARAAANQSAK